MHGRILKRNNRWTYVVDIGRDPDGRRRQQSRGGFPTRKAAESALAEILTAVTRGGYHQPSTSTLASYLAERWQPYIKTRVRPTTAASYETHCRVHLVPHLGSRRLTDLAPEVLNAFYSRLTEARDGRGALSPTTVRLIHATLHRSLADAVRWRLLPTNPASIAAPPRPARPEMSTWDARQLRTFLDRTADGPLSCLWQVIALTGLRRGEALGLRWIDVDLTEGTASVRQTVLPLRHGIIIGEPKTAKGRRHVALDAGTVATLRRHRSAQPATEDRQRLVFCHHDGSPLNPEHISRVFVRQSAEAGLPRIRLHDLRHTHATLALAAGIPTRIVSDRLGHSTTAITADLYQHAVPELERDAAARIAALVYPPAPLRRSNPPFGRQQQGAPVSDADPRLAPDAWVDGGVQQALFGDIRTPSTPPSS